MALLAATSAALPLLLQAGRGSVTGASEPEFTAVTSLLFLGQASLPKTLQESLSGMGNLYMWQWLFQWP